MENGSDIENVLSVHDLGALARRKRQKSDFKTIAKSAIDDAIREGWEIQRENKTSYRVTRAKKKDRLLEDRVWSIFHKMGFPVMSGEGGGFVLNKSVDQNGPKTQIDVVAIDQEVALAVECKSSTTPRKNPNFQKDLAKHSNLRLKFIEAVKGRFPSKTKRLFRSLVFVWDLIPTDNDLARAKQDGIIIFDERDLVYYEEIAHHLGPAARYQFFADIMPGRKIPGLAASVPALRAKMGDHTYFSFSITPEYLLKIAYISHRAKGKASDVNTYQRMVKKSRLKNIRDYISDNGIFPTNIVINLEHDKSNKPRFEPAEQRLQGDDAGGDFGILHLSPSYRSAWIIDGQHRLFAYSGHQKAESAYLNVLAFIGLPPSEQAQLFIDINHEQKSVKRNLLVELYAELNWDAEDEKTRVNAIVSKVIQSLNENKNSPFWGRILLSDDRRTEKRCISLESIFRALDMSLFVIKPKISYGPLWAGENLETLKRATSVLEAWFHNISENASDWWQAGAGEDGGLAMNDGIVVCIGVLKNVFRHLSDKGYQLVDLADNELIDIINPYGKVLGKFLGGLSKDERYRFRRGARGNQGRAAQRLKCEKALNDEFPDFEPPGLKEDLHLLEAKTNEKAYAIIIQAERMLKKIVVSNLKAEHPDDPKLWFYQGVPSNVRKKILDRQNEKQGVGEWEDYFDIMDYRKIVLANWGIFQNTFSFTSKGNKDKKTNWLEELNDIRNIVMHPTKSVTVSFDQLAALEEYQDFLSKAEFNNGDNE
jgi:DNA sulfur modification protein DndB